jgi:predicted CXXCH cytochrome family protein
LGTTSQTSFEDSTTLVVENHYWYRVAAVARNGSVEATGPESFELHVRPMSNEELAMPHAGAGSGTDSCLQCHDTHAAPEGEHLLCMDTDSPDEFCMSCHDGTGSRYDIYGDFGEPAVSRHPVSAGSYATGDLCCTDCHTPHGDPDAEGTYKLVSAYGETGSIEYCLVCHEPDTPDDSTYATRTADMTAYRSSAHNASGVADPPSGTGIKCRTCHLPHTSPNEDLLMYVGYRACFNCHSTEGGASLSSPDIYMRMTANDDIDAHHDVLHRDQDQPGAGRMACQNCHNSHAATEATPCIDPNDPAPWNPYPKTVAAAYSSITNHWENSFCFECHDNTLPSSTDTSPWVEAPVWSDRSGDGTATSDFDDITARWSVQNHGPRSTTSEIVWADVASTFGANPELRCLDCHDPHGTLGVRNLRSDICGRTGLLVVELEDLTGGSGFDSRFFCLGCHQDPGGNHNKGQKSWTSFPKDCSNGGACHGHQNGGGQF